MTTKRWMIAVAIVAGVLSSYPAVVAIYRAGVLRRRSVFCRERSEYFAQIVNDSRRSADQYEAHLLQQQDRNSQQKLKEQAAFERHMERIADPLRRRWDNAALVAQGPVPSLPLELWLFHE
jgi:hypothetical protein